MAKELEKKDNKLAKKEKKKGPNKIFKFFREVFGEVKKLSWPSGKDLATNTATVFAFIVLMAIVIGVLDFAFGQGLGLLAGLGAA